MNATVIRSATALAAAGLLCALAWIAPARAADPPAPAPAAEKPMAEKPMAEKPAAEAPAGEKPMAEKPAKAGANEPEPDYLQADLQRQVSASQAIAELNRKRGMKEAARSLSRIEHMLTYEYTVSGKNDEEALTEASAKALINAASRLYFDDFVLVDRDLLQPYLRNYGDRFVARRTVTSRNINADGSVSLKVRLGVDVDRFYADLRQKHFVAKPEVRPVMAVLLSEIVDGQASSEGRGRRILEESLRSQECRVETRRMLPQPVNVDATEGDALAAAREEAQRGGVEVIVTGTLIVNQDKAHPSSDILYDTFYFYDASVKLTMIRVDNGEILGTASERFAASAEDDPTTPDNEGPTNAMDKTFEELMPRAAKVMTAGFLNDWRRTMLDVADYRLLVTNANDDQLRGVLFLLKTFSPKIQTYTKARFGDVAVINVFLPESKPGEIEEFLRKSRMMQFQVRVAKDRRIELQLL